MKINKSVRQQGALEKPTFGGIYRTTGSRFLYISFNYFRQRLRFPTDREDTPANREELTSFMSNVGEKIRNRTLQFDKVFYWIDDATKAHFSALEGRDFKPEPEHVLFGDYAKAWMEREIPAFSSITKRRYYKGALSSRVLPYFENMSFASISATEIGEFIDNLKRYNNSQKPLSSKRVKNIICPMTKIWDAACNDHNWTLRNPFSDISTKYKAIEEKELQDKERQLVMMNGGGDEEVASTRDVLLLSEWQRLLKAVDSHYHPVMELLLMGMIGSELEALQKQNIKEDAIQVRCSVVRDKGGEIYLKFKPKNWYRKRNIPLTGKLKALMGQATASSTSNRTIKFDNNIELPASAFVLTMKDGKPFNYESFKKNIWDKAVKTTGMDRRVPYASRHTFVQWTLLIGVAKSRLVDLMGHSTKKMIDEVYGNYRQGLVDEREMILDYLGEDFLALEELRTYFPDRYQKAMKVTVKNPEKSKAPDLAITFGQSFGQSQGLYADNYA